MALEGTSVREPLRHPAVTQSAFWKAGIGTGPETLGSCLKACQLSTQCGDSHTGELAMAWRVLGIFLSAQSDAGALTSLSALVHRDLWLFRHTDELQKSEIPIEKFLEKPKGD